MSYDFAFLERPVRGAAPPAVAGLSQQFVHNDTTRSVRVQHAVPTGASVPIPEGCRVVTPAGFVKSETVVPIYYEERLRDASRE